MSTTTEIKHGTPGGAQQHYLRGERPCDACRIANREYTNDWRRKRDGYADKMVYRVGFLYENEEEPKYSRIFTSSEELDAYIQERDDHWEWNLIWVEESPPPRWMMQ